MSNPFLQIPVTLQTTLPYYKEAIRCFVHSSNRKFWNIKITRANDTPGTGAVVITNYGRTGTYGNTTDVIMDYVSAYSPLDKQKYPGGNTYLNRCLKSAETRIDKKIKEGYYETTTPEQINVWNSMLGRNIPIPANAGKAAKPKDKNALMNGRRKLVL
jgi:predicted DNA-binding WGR domain protein